MDFIMIQYIEVSAIGIIILLTMLFYIIGIQRDTVRKDQNFFVRMLICNILILISDVTIYLVRWHTRYILIIANHLACILYFVLHAYFGYLWLRYTIVKLYPEYEPSRKEKILWLLPVTMNGLLAVVSPWTKWIYDLTEQNRYVRGNFMWVSITLSCLYWVASAILTIKERIHPKLIREQSVYWTLLFSLFLR